MMPWAAVFRDKKSKYGVTQFCLKWHGNGEFLFSCPGVKVICLICSTFYPESNDTLNSFLSAKEPEI